MVERRRTIDVAVAVVLTLATLLGACGATATSTPAPPTAVAGPTAAAATPTQASPTATRIPPTATGAPSTATPQGPTVGGELVWAVSSEVDTLDATKSTWSLGVYYLGSTLVALDPERRYVPYLAESWKVSDDGLAWDFVLRKGVKFHDGTPLTAADLAWTFTRAIDPETKSPALGAILGSVKSAEATDTYTLRLNLNAPTFPLLFALTNGLAQPMSKAAVEKAGEGYGMHPVGVGPFKFKEWIRGDRVVFERNPDFAWAPGFVKNKGAFYLQNLVFRYLPEASTVLAGLESGEIDYAQVETKDVDRLKATGKFQLTETYIAGTEPYVLLNVAAAPLDDVRVRKALNMAVDRKALVDVVALGKGVVQNGPLTPNVLGYWSGIEALGTQFDLAGAKALLKEAGWTPGTDGILTKDGKPFTLDLWAVTTLPTRVKTAEVLQQQLKALGIDVTIQQKEENSSIVDILGGNYQAAVFGVWYGEADLLYLLYHSKGGINVSQVKDPELDKILESTRSTTEQAARQEAVNQAQKRIVEQAYIVPLYAATQYYGMSSRVQGALWLSFSTVPVLNDAYIVIR